MLARARRSFRHGRIPAARIRRGADYLRAALERVRACIADLGLRIADSLRNADLTDADSANADSATVGTGDRLSAIRNHSAIRIPQSAMTTFDVVIVGYGNVARRFVSLLSEQRRTLAHDHGVAARVIATATRRHGYRYGGRKRRRRRPLCSSWRDALSKSRAAARKGRLVVVETTTLDIAARAAGDRATSALRWPAARTSSPPTKDRWRSLIDALARAAARAGRQFLFEGAVMDGIPIFNLVRETLPAVTVAGFRGVVNSTTNLHPDRDGTGAAVRRRAGARCRRAGSPRRTRRSTSTAGTRRQRPRRSPTCCSTRGITPHEVERQGITAATGRAAQSRRVAAGRRLKLVARARRERTARSWRASAAEELPAADLLAGARGHSRTRSCCRPICSERSRSCSAAASLTQTAYALVSRSGHDRARQARQRAPVSAGSS